MAFNTIYCEDYQDCKSRDLELSNRPSDFMINHIDTISLSSSTKIAQCAPLPRHSTLSRPSWSREMSSEFGSLNKIDHEFGRMEDIQDERESLSTLDQYYRKVHRMRSSEDYTIGLICALSFEMQAARAMLDDIHDVLPSCPSDSNTYTLGTMSGHNVVIAYLPSEGRGTTSAATAATQMLFSFKCLRFFLFVGIGSGVPRENNDIRLGDIVVSRATASSGGMVFYNANMTARKSCVQYIGAVRKPPSVLLSAVSILEAHNPIYSEQLSWRLNSLSHTVAYGMRPGAPTDWLFEAEYEHEASREPCSQCDQNRLVTRPARLSGSPVVHYGLIASGGQVVENGTTRDRLGQELGNICFEMEAFGLSSGLMAQLPCIVIRGISDYADSHKNKAWQKYASATAAAYARELLSVISSQHVAEMTLVTSAMSHSEQVAQFSRWLTPLDVEAQQRDHLAKRTKDTGSWLLGSKEFKNWMSGAEKERIFWLSGEPGAGKTTLCATVIDHLTETFKINDRVGIAYLYGSYVTHNRSGFLDLLVLLLKQLVQRMDMLPEALQSLYEIHIGRNTRLFFKELLDMMRSVMSSYSRVFVIIDGLDECVARRQDQEHLLGAIVQLQKENKLHLFTTWDFTSEILNKVDGITSMAAYTRPEDVQLYLSTQLPQLLQSGIPNPLVPRKNLLNDVVEATDGTFLRAKLFVNCLASQVAPHNMHLVVREFQSLPRGNEGLNDIYTRAMKNIEIQEEGNRALAKRTLAWVVHAKRPLAAAELQHALSTLAGNSKLDREDLPDLDVLQSACAGLITIEGHYDVIRLVHHTTQQYFEQSGRFWLPNADKDLALTCLTYLSSEHFASGHCKSDQEFEARLRSFAFYNYAARYWGCHARAVSTEIKLTILKFLQDEDKVSSCCQALFAGSKLLYHGYSQDVPRYATALHLASYFGLSDVVDSLLDSGYEPHAMDSYGRTPLWWASASGHGRIIKILLDNRRSDPNLQDKSGQTSLSEAAKRGNKEIVDILLSAGVRPDPQDDGGRTPISWAAEMGHEHILRKLLGMNGTDPNYPDNDGRTPLSWAAERGWVEIIKLLLAQKRVDPDYQDKYGRSSLSRAAENGWIEILEVFLASDRVNTESLDKDGRTPLSWAAEKGHAEIVKRLLAEHAVHLDWHDKHGHTPLSRAVRKGNIKIVQILQSYGLEKAFQEAEVQNIPRSGMLPPKGDDIQNSKRQRLFEAGLEHRRALPERSRVSESAPLLSWKQFCQVGVDTTRDYEMQIMLLERQQRRRLMKR